jgi:electron transfer flavoprotein beta subunit
VKRAVFVAVKGSSVNIVVLLKEVPDTYGDRQLVLETGLVDRESGDRVGDEVGERALEAALTVQTANPGTAVTVMTMGPSTAETAIRKALAMGADDAVHIVDDALAGADLTLTAEVLAAALRRQDVDLVVTGNLSTDGGGGVIAAMLAEHLGFAQATNLSSLSIDDGTLTGTRATDGGSADLATKLPVVASITEALPEPRFPAFKGIMAAKKKPIVKLTAEELDADVLGERAPRSIVVTARQRPARSAGITVTDDGDGGKQLAEYLLAEKLV